MKVFKKKLRTINVDGNIFKYIVNENKYHINFRAYARNSKTTFFEATFCWRDTWDITLYKPSFAAALIRFALENAWNHLEDKQVMSIRRHWHYKNLIVFHNELQLIILHQIGHVDKVFFDVHKKLVDYWQHNDRLTNEGADIIDNAFKNTETMAFLSVDRTRLEESRNAWVYTKIEAQTDLNIENYDFHNINASKDVQPNMFYSFHIKEGKGVLTWVSR